MDLTQADTDDINESMGRFEAALAAQEPQIPEVRPARVLLALDGSNQDDTTQRLAARLAADSDAQVVPVYAYEGQRDEAREDYLAQRVAALESQGVILQRPERDEAADDLRSYDRILRAAEEHHCDLIVLDAPYLDDFTQLGSDSVGADLDVLMGRSSVPLLVVREPKDDPLVCFDHVVLLIAPFGPQTVVAAAWALQIGRTLHAVAVVDRETIESAGELLEDLDDVNEEALAGLQRPAIAGLIAALQRQAARRDLRCRVLVRSGEVVEEIIALADAHDSLIVVGGPRQSATAAGQRVQALARLSRNPVLIV